MELEEQKTSGIQLDLTIRAEATGSGARRWLNCPGSVALGRGIVEAEKEYAVEGTEFHRKVAEALAVRKGAEDIEDEFVRTCVSEVIDLGGYEATELYIETRLHLFGSSGGVDCFWYDERTKTIFVLDWKYGLGKRVRADNNEQIAFYLTALKDKFPRATKAYASIIQPRLEGELEDSPAISSWTWTWRDFKFWRERIEAGLAEVDRGTEFRSGDWCGFCKARPICPAYTSHVAYTQAESELITLSSNVPVSVERVAMLLKQKKRVEGWFKKAEEYLLQLAKTGTHVPGFRIGNKKTQRKWKDIPQEMLVDILKSRGVEEPLKRSLLSLTAVEKICKIDDLVEKPKGEEVLVPDEE